MTVLSSDPDTVEASLKKVADDNKIAHTPLTVFENNVGPAKYNINPAAFITIMMWVDSNVKVNYAIEEGKLTDELIAKIVSDTAKILN